MAIAKEVPSGKLDEIPEGWAFYDPVTGDELKAVDMMRDVYRTPTAMVRVPEDLAKEMLAKNAALISDADLAGKGREDEPHITLKYGVREDLGQIAEALAEFYPFEVVLGKTKIFSPSQNSMGAAVVYVEVLAPILDSLHTKLGDAIGLRHDGSDYVPHVTLAYVKPEETAKYDGCTDFEGMTFTASCITVTRSDRKQVEWRFDLGGAHVVSKAGDEEDDEIEEIIFNVLQGFDEIVPVFEHELQSANLDGAQELADGLDVESKVEFSVLNENALKYARKRAAEMVGKRWVGGELVENPDARWAITETTRDVLRNIIEDAFTQGQTPAQLAASIERTGVFGSTRADLIASTEMSRAVSQGSLSTAKEVGAIGKGWETSGDHDHDDECDDNEADGVIGIDEDFSSGDDASPGHPGCNCAVVYYTADDPEAADLLEPETENAA